MKPKRKSSEENDDILSLQGIADLDSAGFISPPGSIKMKTPGGKVIYHFCSKFPQYPTRALARFILENYGSFWNWDIERIRSAIRSWRGKSGDLQRFKRKHIIPSNVVIPVSWNRICSPFIASPGRYLVLSDLHIPFHSIMAVEAAIAYGQKVKCTHILLNGDFQDCLSVTFWPSLIRPRFTEELAVVIQMLDFIRKEFPKAQIIYKPGNHEYRLPAYYARNCKVLMNSPIAAMESMIDFEARGVEFLDYFQRINLGNLPVYHGHEFRTLTTAVNPARGLLLKTKSWCAVSHFHRTSEHTDMDINDVYLTTWSFGCLCNLHPDYMPAGGNWNHGFAVIDVERKNGHFEVSNKRILPSGRVV